MWMPMEFSRLCTTLLMMSMDSEWLAPTSLWPLKLPQLLSLLPLWPQLLPPWWPLLPLKRPLKLLLLELNTLLLMLKPKLLLKPLTMLMLKLKRTKNLLVM